MEDKFEITISPPEDTAKKNMFDHPKEPSGPTKVSTQEETGSDIVFLSIEDEISKKKNPREIYFRELSKINQYQNIFNKEIKTSIEGVHKIKKEISLLKEAITKIDAQIIALQDKECKIKEAIAKSNDITQETLNNLQKIVEEIKVLEGTKQTKTNELKLKLDEELFNAQTAQVSLLKEKKDKIELVMQNFEAIEKHTQPLLSTLASKKGLVDNLQKELEEIKSKSQSTEEAKAKCKEEINNSLKTAYEHQEKLLNECETLRIQLDEKMKQTITINKTINKGNYYLELIDKYGDKYLEIDKKQKEFEDTNTQYTEKEKEYSDVIERIKIFNNKYSDIVDKLNESIATMENFLNIEIIQTEQIESYSKDISSLKALITLNNEKVELLDLDNKTMEAEIQPCDAKISRMENEKKSKINKGDFSSLNDLIKKIKQIQESKDKFVENIKKFQKDISTFEAENMRLISEIESKKKLSFDLENELRESKINYLKSYENVINNLPERMRSEEMIKEEVAGLHEEIKLLDDEFREEACADPIAHKPSNLAFRLSMLT